MSDSVGQYLNEIGLVPLLTAAEERELSQIIERGAEARARIEAGESGPDLDRAVRRAAAAKDRFIRANLRLVVSVARRYPLPPSMELLDLVQEGNLGSGARRRQVRLAQGVQVLHLRHVLDPPGHRPGTRPEGEPGPPARRPFGRCAPPCVRCPATVTSSTTSTPGSTASPRPPRSTAPSATTTRTSWSTSSPTRRPAPSRRSSLDADDSEWSVGLLDVLDPRARRAVEQRFGLTTASRRATARSARSSASPPRPLDGSSSGR
jgi:RNA polymerase primary sigma factor